MASTQTGWFDHTALDNAIERSRKVKKKRRRKKKYLKVMYSTQK